MSCSNNNSNFSRKPRMSVRQVWKRKTSTPKSSSTLQNESPPFHPHVHPQISSPPSYNPLRDEMINSLHNISTILDTHNNPSNAYNQAPPSPPPQQIYPPSHGTRDEVSDQHSYCFNVEDDPKTFDKAMKSRDVALWKKAINDEMDSIIGNNTWVLADLPSGCKPLSCKWIFKRKLKVDGTIKKFKARLFIHGFRQKSGIEYFNTYASVARISIIRLLIIMASIHNLIIHHMDVKIAFLNGELDEEEFLSSRFSMKDMGEADVILGIRIKHESNGIAISQSHYIQCWKVTLMQAGSATLKTIHLLEAEYSCLVELLVRKLNVVPADYVPADYVSAGHVPVPADRDRIC
ncbi:zinc finger, CCHC-type containing protein [Tanacetum coccineum]